MKRLFVVVTLLLAMTFAATPASADPGVANGAWLDLSGNITWE